MFHLFRHKGNQLSMEQRNYKAMKRTILPLAVLRMGYAQLYAQNG